MPPADSEVEVLDGRARVDRVPRQHRIEPRVERDVEPVLGKLIGRPAKRHVLPCRRAAGRDRAPDGSLAPEPDAVARIVGLEIRVGPLVDGHAGFDARQQAARAEHAPAAIEDFLELGGRALVAAPGERERQAAVRAGDSRAGELRAVREPVAVLEIEQRQEHQPQAAPANDARGLIGLGLFQPFDLHPSFIDDDDEEHLRGIGDRRVPLQHLHALEAMGGLEAAGDLGRGVGREDRADVDPGETADFGVRRQHVAVDPDLGHDPRAAL